MAFAQLRGVKVIDPEGDLIIEVGTLSLPAVEEKHTISSRNEWTSGWWDREVPPNVEDGGDGDFANGQSSANATGNAAANASTVTSVEGASDELAAGSHTMSSLNPHDVEQPEQAQAGRVSESNTPYQPVFRMLVCSKVLKWASPVFKAMLDGKFKEGQKPTEPNMKRTIRFPEADPGAVRLLCQILHHKPKAYSTRFHYNVLNNMAILGDMYYLSKTLRPWFRDQMRGYIPTHVQTYEICAQPYSHMRCLEAAKIAYLIDDPAIFREATAYLTYLATPKDVESQLPVLFKERTVPDGLIERITAMQAHHICRFSSLGPDCSKKIIYRAGPWRMLPEERDGVWSLDPWIRQRIGFDRSVVIDEENYYTMCEGRSKLLKFVKAHVFGWTQLDQNVDDREFHSVRGYISHLRNFEKVKAQDFRCGRNYCDECRRARFYVRMDLKMQLEDSLKALGEDGICLGCVNGNRPFTGHCPGPCQIHKLGWFD